MIRKYLPSFILSFYHFSLAFLAAVLYGFPSRKMIVVGVTGTKGKTTVCNLLAQIFESAGYKTGLATTVNFRIGDREWVNDTKQTMLGRFALQKLLYRMKKEGCRYAVIETSSEGIVQYRHRFIDYKTAVFTNLSPEHIERHGGLENYRAAKVQLFEKVSGRKDGIGVYNLDDESVNYFLKPKMAKKYGYTSKSREQSAKSVESGIEVFEIKNIRLGEKKSGFIFGGREFEMPLIGEFNVYNAAAAATAAFAEGIPFEKSAETLKNARQIPGRMEVSEAKGFRIIIDYAHEPKSLESAYKAVEIFKPRKMICVLGAQGGGRDEWKRREMGKVAAAHCDVLILTNEDPYDEPPERIVTEIEGGALEAENEELEIKKITDRQEAIRTAISLAKTGDAVVLTGKGGEVWMCVGKGQKIPWNEKVKVQEILGGRTDAF